MAVHDMLMAAAGGTSADVAYIDDVFSTYLYTGNGSTQTITNGIDLATKGGLVWIKNRTQAVSHTLYDTIRGGDRRLFSNYTNAEQVTSPPADSLTFNNDGFSAGAGSTGTSNIPYVSWTFAKQEKFFDVVTYTGNGNNSRTINHSLNGAVGFILIKQTNADGDWFVWHRGDGTNNVSYMPINKTQAGTNVLWSSLQTSTYFTPHRVQNDLGGANESGATYVAYLFAHDAGGFGAAGTDNVISCGSLTTDASGIGTATLGFEPQWILYKRAIGGAASWGILDNMRGWTVSSGTDAFLAADLSSAETTTELGYPTATGFAINEFPSSTYIYIAIRRPMKPPTTGTEVFSPNLQGSNNTATSPNYPTNFPVDLMIRDTKLGASAYPMVTDRLRGGSPYLTTSNTSAETADTTWKFDSMTGYYAPGAGANSNVIGWSFKRAPGFFDVVCYTGTGSARTVNHNLTVAPELIIVKRRNSSDSYWRVLATALPTLYGNFNVNNAFNSGSGALWGDGTNYVAPTATTFTVSASSDVNNGAGNFVAYLFASCPGVSKVGSYTGNGSSQTINCGFSGGARFFLVKRTDSTGDWWVYDSARGIVSNADPALRMNSTAAEVTSADAVDPTSSGIIVNQESTCNINVNSATYIYLAIA